MTKQQIIDTLWHLGFQFDGDKAVIDKHTIGIIADTILTKIEQEKKEQAREIFEKLKEECSYEGYLYGLDYLEIAEIAKEYGVEL